MEELFNPQLPGGERSDIQLCIFPHLREFLVIDLRPETPRVLLLNTADVFNSEFYRSVEAEFSEALREETEFPFAHLINLPLRLEEAVRETAMSYILDHLGINTDGDEQIPTVVVFIVSGGALAVHSERVIDGLRELLRTRQAGPAPSAWDEVLSRLVSEENNFLQKLNRVELTEALSGDSPDYFTLWENRN
jgi:hypothetical protein